MKFLYVIAFALLSVSSALVVGAQPAHAQWQGELSSSLVAKLPLEQRFTVVIYDDTDANLTFRRQFLAALAKTGRTVSEEANLVFTFTAGITWRPERLRELEAQRRRRYPVDQEEASFPFDRESNLTADTRPLLFGDRRLGPPRIEPSISNRDRDRLDIAVELRDRATSRLFWTADLALPLLSYDRERIARSIIGPIIAAIGEDRTRQRFEVR